MHYNEKQRQLSSVETSSKSLWWRYGSHRGAPTAYHASKPNCFTQDNVSKKLVARIMHELGVRAAQGIKKIRTTLSDSEAKYPENVLERRFSPSAPGQVLTTDTTYLLTREGFLYLGVKLDPFSRKVLR